MSVPWLLLLLLQNSIAVEMEWKLMAMEGRREEGGRRRAAVVVGGRVKR